VFPKKLSMTKLVGEIAAALADPCRRTGLDIDQVSYEFVHFLCDFELKYILSRRHEIWRIK